MKVKHGSVGIAVAASLVLLAASFASGSIAQTTDDGPPQMDLRWPGHSLQQGSRGSFCWPDADGNGICVDIVSGFPKAMWVRSGAKMKIRIHYAEKPDEFGVTASRTVTKQGYGEGKARRIDATLKPVQRNGVTRGWDAVFTLRGQRHYYMDAFGAWDAGDASWKFHARTVKT